MLILTAVHYKIKLKIVAWVQILVGALIGHNCMGVLERV